MLNSPLWIGKRGRFFRPLYDIAGMLLKFCLQMLQNGFDTLDGYLQNLSGGILS